MLVNEQADGVAELRARIAQLESGLRAFVHPTHGYTSGVRNGKRWCSPRVTQEQMDKARELVTP